MVSKLRNLWPRDNRLSRTDSRKYQAPEHVEKRDTQGGTSRNKMCQATHEVNQEDGVLPWDSTAAERRVV